MYEGWTHFWDTKNTLSVHLQWCIWICVKISNQIGLEINCLKEKEISGLCWLRYLFLNVLVGFVNISCCRRIFSNNSCDMKIWWPVPVTTKLGIKNQFVLSNWFSWQNRTIYKFWKSAINEWRIYKRDMFYLRLWDAITLE